jgi:hypothetical protein
MPQALAHSCGLNPLLAYLPNLPPTTTLIRRKPTLRKLPSIILPQKTKRIQNQISNHILPYIRPLNCRVTLRNNIQRRLHSATQRNIHAQRRSKTTTGMDIDYERNIITLNTPEKGSNPRMWKVNPTLIEMLRALPKRSEQVFPWFTKINENNLQQNPQTPSSITPKPPTPKNPLPHPPTLESHNAIPPNQRPILRPKIPRPQIDKINRGLHKHRTQTFRSQPQRSIHSKNRRKTRRQQRVTRSRFRIRLPERYINISEEEKMNTKSYIAARNL